MSYCNDLARQASAIFLVVSAFATEVACSAKEARSLHVPGPSTAERQLEAALAEEADFDFYELPIIDLVDYLRERLPTPVVLDQVALADEGYDPQQLTVTGTFETTPLRSALLVVLLPLDLDLSISHDVLWITTRDVAEYQLIVRCYDVGALLDAWSASFPSSAGPPGNLRRMGRNRKDMAYSHCEIPVGTPAAPEEALTSLVTSIVEPDSWDVNGGEGALAYCPPSRVLVVSQSYRVHCELAPLLEELTARVPRDDQPEPAPTRLAPAGNSQVDGLPWQSLLDWLTGEGACDSPAPPGKKGVNP